MAGEEYLGLSPCGSGEFFFLLRLRLISILSQVLLVCATINLAPNCFCSTDNIEDSPDTNIPPFKWPVKQFSSHVDAFQQLYEVVKVSPFLYTVSRPLVKEIHSSLHFVSPFFREGVRTRPIEY